MDSIVDPLLGDPLLGDPLEFEAFDGQQLKETDEETVEEEGTLVPLEGTPNDKLYWKSCEACKLQEKFPAQHQVNNRNFRTCKMNITIKGQELSFCRACKKFRVRLK